MNHSPSVSAISTPSFSSEEGGVGFVTYIDVDDDTQDSTPPTTVAESSVVKTTSPQASPPVDQLRVDFSVLRIIALAMLILGPVLTLVGLLVRDGEGICIERYTGNVTFQDDDAALVGYVSSYTSFGEVREIDTSIAGTMMSGVNKAIDFVLEILVSVACLGLFTKWSTQTRHSSARLKYTPKIVAISISFLLSNGLTSINVQEVTGKLHPFISDADLQRIVFKRFFPTYEDSGSLLALSWNKSYAETAIENPVGNTALRTYFQPAERINTNCTGESTDDSLYIKPIVVVTTQPEDWGLPIDTHTVRRLFALALIGLTTGDDALWPSQQSSGIVSSINEAIESQLNATAACAINDSTTYDSLLDCVPDETLANVTSKAFETIFQSAINSSANFTIHRLADSINFTSLTISYSVKLANDTKSGDQLQCSEDGCTFIDTDETLKRGDQMVGIARLPGDAATTNERLVVRSTGKRLEGDSFDIDESQHGVVLTGLRMRYTLTVGLLNWKAESLNKVLGTECRAEFDCNGLRVKNAFLGSEKIAFVGQSALDFSDLPNVAKSLNLTVISSLNSAVSNKPMASPWIRLVSIINSRPHAVIAPPRNFNTVSERVAEYLRSRDPSTCAKSVARLLKEVEASHLYIEDSLQIAYTAPFHYLVQHGVLHSVMYDSVVVFRNGEQETRIMASTPPMNAIVSLIGCAVLFVMCVAVALCHKRSKAIIEANSNATNIAQAMLNDSMYPRAVLSLWLEQPNGEDKTTPRLVKLDDVVLDRAAFKDKPKPPPKKSR